MWSHQLLQRKVWNECEEYQDKSHKPAPLCKQDTKNHSCSQWLPVTPLHLSGSQITYLETWYSSQQHKYLALLD